MRAVAVPYHHYDEKTNGFESTTRIVSYMTFADIKELKDEWEINDNMEIPDPTFVEAVMSKLIGCKVELVDKKLQNLDDKDIELIGHEIKPIWEDALGIKLTDEISTEIYKRKMNTFIKKKVFRIVEPHQLWIVRQKLRDEPINMEHYKTHKLVIPEFYNINSAYSVKRDDVFKLTVDDLKNRIKAESITKNRNKKEP